MIKDYCPFIKGFCRENCSLKIENPANKQKSTAKGILESDVKITIKSNNNIKIKSAYNIKK